MPPKQRGHNARGRDKVFRNAVEHVHVGIGHAVLGSVSLQLAEGPRTRGSLTDAVRQVSATSQPAFYLELNHQMLSHTSKDYKKFRWEVIELCETRALFLHKQRTIAQKLISCLLDRSGGSYSHKSNSLHTANGNTGSTGEGFEAFVRLTIAFARDLQENFFPYVEVFQKAVHAGLHDKHGRLLADAKRLQLLYSAQVAWYRELATYWGLPQHRPLVRRVVRLYIEQLGDPREYIRRLAAEVLAYLCRMCRELLPLVVEEACGDVLLSFHQFAVEKVKDEQREAHPPTEESAIEGAEDEEEVANQDSSNGEMETAGNPSAGEGDVSAELVWTRERVIAFGKDLLPVHPVVDGLCFFAAELFRGMQGTLSSNFEYNYARLLQAFLLLDESGMKTVVECSAALAAHMHDELESEEAATQEADGGEHRRVFGLSTWVHGTRFRKLFAVAGSQEMEVNAEEAPAALGREDDLPDSESVVAAGRDLIRRIGGTVLGTTLQAVLRETRKRDGAESSRSEHEDDDDDEEEQQSEDDVGKASHGDAEMRSSQRLLGIVMACFQPDVFHVRLVSLLLSAADCLLWKDARALALLRRLAQTLLAALTPERWSSCSSDFRVVKDAHIDLYAAVLELLHPLCLSPSLTTSRCYGSPSASSHPTDSHSMRVQQAFLPLGREVVRLLSETAYVNTREGLTALSAAHVRQSEATQLVLFAFAQDVLHKHYTFCMAEERRIGEEDGGEDLTVFADDNEEDDSHVTPENSFADEGGRNDDAGSLGSGLHRPTGGAAAVKRVGSSLTPFALTLLHSIYQGALVYGVDCLQGYEAARVTTEEEAAARRPPACPPTQLNGLMRIYCRSVERSVLLARAAHDRTIHMQSSPLQQLLRVKPHSSKRGVKPIGGEALSHSLFSLLWHLTQLFIAEKKRAGDGQAHFTEAQQQVTPLVEAAELLACALPLAHALVQKINDAAVGDRANQLRSGFLAVLRVMEEEHDWHNATLYSLYAQVAALLVHLTTHSPVDNGRVMGQGKKTKGRPGVVVPSTCGEGRAQRMESLRHLGLTIDMLAKGYQENSSAHCTDSFMAHLLQGTELLLQSLVWLFGLDIMISPMGTASSLHTLPASTREALRTLKRELSESTQRHFTTVILHSGLVSPVQSLRVLTLRLLQLLCHPQLSEEEERLAGASAIEVDFFSGLLGAEQFNPLSSTGNLDGIRHALAKLSFASASGSIVDPLSRIILARSMVGLLYMKFSEAWPIALGILADLVRSERTTLLPTAEGDSEVPEGVDDAETEVPTGRSGTTQRSRLLEPSVWETVVVPSARLLVFGDVGSKDNSALSLEVPETMEEEVDGAGAPYTDADRHVRQLVNELQHVRCAYRINLTNMQRHGKGELVSKAFSSTQYVASVLTVVDLCAQDDEVLTWASHWRPLMLSAYTMSSMSAKSTHRATLAKTFLGGLGTMMKHSSALDRKVCLVEDIVREMVGLQYGDGPSGIAGVKSFDDRLTLAMQACSAAPTTILSNQQLRRVPAAIQVDLRHRNEQLTSLFLLYLSDSNPRLQRAALDNLKRLKVEPYSSYHAQLLPYCDMMKNLFNFLSSFNMETDIAGPYRASYVSAVLCLALPNLVSRVSKDQAVLSRRIMGFLTQLSQSHGDALVGVMDSLIQQMVFSGIRSATPLKGGESSTQASRLSVKELDFLGIWRRFVSEQQLHATRRVERLAKQLFNAMRLLEALLHAVGQKFSCYVNSCMHLAMQTYLVACKHLLRREVDVVAEGIAQEDGVGRARTSAWCHQTYHALSSKALTSSLANLRRAATTVVALLFEQFPLECMTTARSMTSDPSISSAPLAVRDTVIGRYVAALYANSKGTSQEGLQRSSPDTKTLQGPVAKAHIPPVLRLVITWVHEPVLLPLLPAFSHEVMGMFEDAFAVSSPLSPHSDRPPGGTRTGPLHRSSPKAMYEALRCVTSVLHLADQELEPLGNARATSRTTKKPAHAVTLRSAFIDPCMTHIFTSLYRLVVSGAEEGAEVSRGAPSRKSRSGAGMGMQALRQQRSVMSFTLPMWREIIQTVSLLTQYVASQSGPAVSTPDTASHFVGIEQEKLTVSSMIARLVEIALRFVLHPICTTDSATVIMAARVVRSLLALLTEVDPDRHLRPLAHLLNVLSNPHARLILCDTLQHLVGNLRVAHASARYPVASDISEEEVQAAFQEQLAAVARALRCLNSFDDDEDDEDSRTLGRYNFELRYHAFHSLIDFFTSDGRYGALRAKKAQAAREGADGKEVDAVRQERQYNGRYDTHIPVQKRVAPVLCVEAWTMLSANAMFLLRDSESTIRALAAQLVQAMIRYAVKQNGRVSGASYDTLVLEEVIRSEILSSLRRGVVSRDVHIRNDHMKCFAALGKYYAEAFPSMALLHSPNTEQNFFLNVGHVQPKCRLHALALLRQAAPRMTVRDVLRVFVPFLLSAVKDFAQGKRELQNLTEGRAKGYCDAVLLTIASMAGHLPWEGYYRVLTLLLSNAKLNADLQGPMLRGVVHVLDHFHYLDAEGRLAAGAATVQQLPTAAVSSEDDESVGGDEDDVAASVAELLRAKRSQYRSAKLVQVLEDDIIPQLLSFIADERSSKKELGMGGGGGGVGKSNPHTITNVRREQEKEQAAKNTRAMLQLPVAVAITKIVKHFPEERYTFYVEYLMDDLIKRLRTKNDKQRESARRVLGAMLRETGPGKLRCVITKLRDNLVHGYQLHVLGYTVVTLLYQLYEPQSAVLQVGRTLSHRHHHTSRRPRADEAGDVDMNDLLVKTARAPRATGGVDDTSAEVAASKADTQEGEDPTDADEEALLQQLTPNVTFDYAYGVECLTECMDELFFIFLDDYLGEIGHQKEQVEVMSIMVEVKRNRSLQGFSLVARHCASDKVMTAFLERMTWVLTPPSDTTVDTSELHGSARARALVMQEMRNKYVTLSKNAVADLVFVNKVRLLAVRVARSLLTNPTLQVSQAFQQVSCLLQKHNTVREEKIRAFEAKDGTRRLRGNAHTVLHKAERRSWKEQLNSNYLIAPVPERVDVDFSAHTVLATQQKQKLRVYKGRYGKEVQEAAKDFYREDPTTAVVLDTLDEFLLKFLLSVLKQVLGIGKEKKAYSSAALRLDLMRQQKRSSATGDEAETHEEGTSMTVGGEADNPVEGHEEEEAEEPDSSESEEPEANDAAELMPTELGDDDEDALGHFAEAQEGHDDGAESPERRPSKTRSRTSNVFTDLTSTFTRGHRPLLESLVPVVLTTLQGEGSDAVVANALDCLLALVSLRPPLGTVGSHDEALLHTVTAFFGRGGPIKQRALRVCASVIAHQKFNLTEEQTTRLVGLIRAEIVDRSECLPMALGLLHAILSKHVHIVEVYDVIDLVTELLVHLAGKRVVRHHCIRILIRFLTEYRMTPEKFRSHLDQLYSNLDYPELGGRLALLDLLDGLIVRLPTVVLRQEAAMLLVPLAATLTSSEWRACRQRAGELLQHLVKHGGVDVLVPLLSGWMQPTQARPTRAMAMHAWATMIPVVAELHGLPGSSHPTHEASEEDQDAFGSCIGWSLPMVLDGCLYDPIVAVGRTKSAKELPARERAKLEMKGWTEVYFSLRCAEAIVTALPRCYYPRVAPSLVPWLSQRLILHSHPWVQAVAVRLMRHYCYSFVEEECAYVQDDWTAMVPLRPHTSQSEPAGGEACLPFILHCRQGTPDEVAGVCGVDSIQRAKQVLVDTASVLKCLIGRVGMSDVSNETYTGHRAMADPARAEGLKLMVYLLRTMAHVSLALLVSSGHHGRRTAGDADGIRALIQKEYRLLQRQLHALCAPVVQRRSVVNYLVRSATLVQLLGGYVSVLPRPAIAEGHTCTTEPAVDPVVYNGVVRWMLKGGVGLLPFVHDTVAPMVSICNAAAAVSVQLTNFAYQSSSVIQQQLEERRHVLDDDVDESREVEVATVDDIPMGGKRSRRVSTARRERAQKKLRVEEPRGSEPTPALDDVLVQLTAGLATVRESRRQVQVVRETKKVLKRSRREMQRRG